MRTNRATPCAYRYPLGFPELMRRSSILPPELRPDFWAPGLRAPQFQPELPPESSDGTPLPESAGETPLAQAPDETPLTQSPDGTPLPQLPGTIPLPQLPGTIPLSGSPDAMPPADDLARAAERSQAAYPPVSPQSRLGVQSHPELRPHVVVPPLPEAQLDASSRSVLLMREHRPRRILAPRPARDATEKRCVRGRRARRGSR
ncbi:hypothetical protein [Nocardia sp. BMG111209]|uniref:hypothetical protein n=1 Tax=Nocardia sp. BMG111209 TaxID=1160137 RepID=UPI00039A2CB6|nr:hypothetical protein [Nocardia sp. BMG111209]